MARYDLTLNQLKRVLKEQPERIKRAINAGIEAGARRGRSHMLDKGPKDQGDYRKSWAVAKGSTGVVLKNDTPYAGVLERGAKPHFPPLAPLTQWVMRRLGKRGPEAVSIARAIQHKISQEGLPAKYVARMELPELTSLAGKEIDKNLDKAFKP